MSSSDSDDDYLSKDRPKSRTPILGHRSDAAQRPVSESPIPGIIAAAINILVRVLFLASRFSCRLVGRCGSSCLQQIYFRRVQVSVNFNLVTSYRMLWVDNLCDACSQLLASVFGRFADSYKRATECPHSITPSAFVTIRSQSRIDEFGTIHD